jgi:hypothetical protein
MKARFKSSNFFSSSEKHDVYENVEKYCTARVATDDNVAHAHYMVNT